MDGWIGRFLFFSHSVLSDCLWSHGLQHSRLPCPTLSTGVCSNSCPLCRWCHPTISSSVTPLLFPYSNFLSIRVFSNELVLCITWPKYWSFSFSISPSNEHSGSTSFRIDWFDFLAVQGLSRVFSNTIQKHQFFSTPPSLRSDSHIRTWLLEEPELWLHRPLSAKWCICFLTCCLHSS